MKTKKFSNKMFFFNFWRTCVLFVGPLIPLYWNSGDVSKPEWAALFTLGRDIYVLHIP